MVGWITCGAAMAEQDVLQSLLNMLLVRARRTRGQGTICLGMGRRESDVAPVQTGNMHQRSGKRQSGCAPVLKKRHMGYTEADRRGRAAQSVSVDRGNGHLDFPALHRVLSTLT